MSSTYSSQFIDNAFATSTAASDESIRNDLINKILYLIQNVDPADQNTLVKRKIAQMRLERFSLADSMTQDDYYALFLRKLDQATLRRILNEVTSIEAFSLQLKPQTLAALRHVLNGEPAPSTRLAVKEAFDTFGNFFAKTLRETEDAQYSEENIKNPKRTLEQRELKRCGTPAAEIFAQYLPLLKDPTFKEKFNGIIRATLLDPTLSTYQLQIKLLYAASKLADALGNSAQTDAAQQIRSALKSAGFSPRVANTKKTNQSLWRQLYAFPLNLVRALRPTPVLAFKPKSKVEVAPLNANTIPISNNTPEPENPSAKLNELLERISRMQQTYNDPMVAHNLQQKPKEPIKQDVGKNLTFAFNNQPTRPALAAKQPPMVFGSKPKKPRVS